MIALRNNFKRISVRMPDLMSGAAQTFVANISAGSCDVTAIGAKVFLRIYVGMIDSAAASAKQPLPRATRADLFSLL